ncbi:MAG: tetratricopeptide repeat protein [bacterium]|nr:tetratricopeptide repeat protein [bacterium]
MNSSVDHQVRRASIAAVVAAITLIIAAPSQGLPRAKEQWIQLDAGHFTLISNAGERSTRKIGSDLEKFFVVVEEVLGHGLKSPLPSTVYIFKHDSSFKPYKLLWEGKPARISGYFMARADGNHIAVNADQRLEAAGILYHELMHYVVSSNSSPVPLWLNEGLAELYSTFESEGVKVAIGKPVERHVYWLRNQPLIPLQELFTIDFDSPTYNEGQRRGDFYAQSWLLVHYLLMSDGSQRSTLLVQFLDLVRQGVATEEAFRRAFGKDFLAAKAEAGACHTGLGRVMEARQQPEKAMAHYSRAIELDDEDFVAWFRWGSLQLDADPSGSGAGKATEALHRCTELRPGFAPAWGALSYAHTFDDEVEDAAIHAAETAHALFPARSDVAQNLLYLYVRAGRKEPARQLFDRFFASHADSEARLGAQLNLLQFDVEESERLLHEGQLAEALAILERVKQAGGGAPELGWIDARLAEIRDVMKEQDQVDRYNRAIELLNAGDWKAALGVLEQLAAEEPSGDFGEAVRSALEQVRQLDAR